MAAGWVTMRHHRTARAAPGPVGRGILPQPTHPLTGSGRATVTLTMIVRDEEANLPACLSSVQGLFDEIVVVDTGSRDRTKEIALGFGARVFDFAWVDDFAAARNAALAQATGDYAFWLDADVSHGGRLRSRRHLRKWLAKPGRPRSRTWVLSLNDARSNPKGRARARRLASV